MSPEPIIPVRVTHRFSASAERVFDAWLDADRAAKWLFATPTGQMVRAEIDPRAGGEFCFVDRRDGQDVSHEGRYLELERPRRIVFVYSVDGSTATRVTIEISPLETGCELTLTHELPAEFAEHAGRAEQGWAGVLAGLGDNLG